VGPFPIELSKKYAGVPGGAVSPTPLFTQLGLRDFGCISFQGGSRFFFWKLAEGQPFPFSTGRAVEDLALFAALFPPRRAFRVSVFATPGLLAMTYGILLTGCSTGTGLLHILRGLRPQLWISWTAFFCFFKSSDEVHLAMDSCCRLLFPRRDSQTFPSSLPVFPVTRNFREIGIVSRPNFPTSPPSMASFPVAFSLLFPFGSPCFAELNGSPDFSALIIGPVLFLQLWWFSIFTSLGQAALALDGMRCLFPITRNSFFSPSPP